MVKKGIVLVSVATLALSGCQSAGPKQQQAAVLGAVAGGLIGSQIGGSDKARLAAAVMGAVAGGLVGSAIGARLDAEDRERLRQITAETIRTGKARSFKSTKTKVRAKTTVVSTSNASGQLCRTVKQEVVLADGKVAEDNVSACRGPNGWSV